jgi:hypothetical protein
LFRFYGSGKMTYPNGEVVMGELSAQEPAADAASS